jgi:hypothetical protein
LELPYASILKFDLPTEENVWRVFGAVQSAKGWILEHSRFKKDGCKESQGL